MVVVEAKFHRIAAWNPVYCCLRGTVSTLQYLVLLDCYEHIGRGVVVQ